jgi:hypothetical protein
VFNVRDGFADPLMRRVARLFLAIAVVVAAGRWIPDGRAAGNSTTFAVIGDYGWAGPNQAAVAALVDSWSPDFVVTTGDNNYERGSAETIDANVGQYWHKYIGDYGGSFGPGSAENRFYPSLGNHDWDQGNVDGHKGFFALPANERYYAVDRYPVGLFIIDSDPREPDGVSATSRQAMWLRDALQESTACWKLVVFHHPPYSSGQHGSSRYMRWPFAEWGADVVLAGHDHNYERLRVDAILYYVNGLGGKSYRSFGPRVATGSRIRFTGAFGAMRGTATTDSLTFEFITVDGTLIESRTTNKTCSPISRRIDPGTGGAVPVARDLRIDPVATTRPTLSPR